MDTATEVGKSVLRWASDAFTDARYKVEGMYGTDIEKKTKEATSNESWGTSGTLKNEIAKATFDYGESYDQIMTIIWERLEAGAWRVVFKTLTLLEHLIRCGSKRVVDECRMEIYKIRLLNNYYNVDDDGIDRGKSVRALAKKICLLLDDHRVLRKAREETAEQNRRFSVSSNTSINAGASSLSYDQFSPPSFSTPSFHRRDPFASRGYDSNGSNEERRRNFSEERNSDKYSQKKKPERKTNKKEKRKSFRTKQKIKQQKEKIERKEVSSSIEDLIDVNVSKQDNLIETDLMDATPTENKQENLIDVNINIPNKNDLLDTSKIFLNANSSKDDVDDLFKSAQRTSVSRNKEPKPKQNKTMRSQKQKTVNNNKENKSMLAEQKIKNMIPGSSLIDLDGLMSNKKSNNTFRAKGKVKMSEM